MELTELIENAPWREAVTYRNTWPHEYVLSAQDNQAELLQVVVARFCSGEGVTCRFFSMENTYLFIGGHKYWLMVPYEDFDSVVARREDYVLNRAPLYRDRRDFVIQRGDTGRLEDYPSDPARDA